MKQQVLFTLDTANNIAMLAHIFPSFVKILF